MFNNTDILKPVTFLRKRHRTSCKLDILLVIVHCLIALKIPVLKIVRVPVTFYVCILFRSKLNLCLICTGTPQTKHNKFKSGWKHPMDFKP